MDRGNRQFPRDSMRRRAALALVWAIQAVVVWAAPVWAADSSGTDELPAPADRAVDFHREVLPLLARRCSKCHTGPEKKGGFSVETREDVLLGGKTGPAVQVGASATSRLIRLVASRDPEERMPAGADPLSADEIGILRSWIDQGLAWEDGLVLRKTRRKTALELRPVRIPTDDSVGMAANPVDVLLERYFRAHGDRVGDLVDDRIFCRRVFLDLIGLLPSPERLEDFVAASQPDKRLRLVRELLARNRDFADHWLSFWNDHLRNEYRGTGFIDGGRIQITRWLYAALYHNRPFDAFVRDLLAPPEQAKGFLHGIQWRGVVNASQQRELQAAQTISQVFMGTNIKCASCHDSFINDWKLDEAYAFGNVFADEPLETHRCDKATGERVVPAFLYPQLGTIDASAPRVERLRQLGALVTSKRNGRLARTLVNRLWAVFFGRGIIATLDDMDQEPFDADLLEWLAADFQEHAYDLKHVMERICTSRAYQLVAVGAPRPTEKDVKFSGPLVRHMTAEQFVDAVAMLTGKWKEVTPAMLRGDGRGQGGQIAAIVDVLREAGGESAATHVDGRSGRAVRLDGVSEVLRGPHRDALEPRRQITIAAWVRLRGEPLWAKIYSKGLGMAGSHLLALGKKGEALEIHAILRIRGRRRGMQVALESQDLNDGAWHHVAATYDGTYLRIFKDGEAIGEKKIDGDLETDGGQPVFLGDGLHGDLDDVRVYDVALSPASLGSLLGGEEAVAVRSHLIAWWRLDGDLREAIGGEDAVALGSGLDLGPLRAARTGADALQRSLGRPSREQVVSSRESAATTLQALELTNGRTLDEMLERGASAWLRESSGEAKELVEKLYRQALGRLPDSKELAVAEAVVGSPPGAQGLQDLLWILVMLPEFQLIY